MWSERWRVKERHYTAINHHGSDPISQPPGSFLATGTFNTVLFKMALKDLSPNTILPSVT